MKINPKPTSVTVYPLHRVYYFDGWAYGARADEFVRRVRATGRKVSVISAAYPFSDASDYAEVTVGKEASR